MATRLTPSTSWLRTEKDALGEEIEWNFTKFLVGKDGHVIRRYAPTAEPEALAEDIEDALAS